MSDTKYFRIQLSGMGGESSYIDVTKEAYEFWEPLSDDEDITLCDWMLDEKITVKVPDNASFLTNYVKGNAMDKEPWYGATGEFEHSFGVELGSARIVITETDSDENDAEVLFELVDDEELDEYLHSFEDTDLLERGETEASGQYTVQFVSIERGVFFDGFVESLEEFDAKKLRVTVCEYPNGEDVVTMVEYDGTEVDNIGGDTLGKGFAAYVWEADVEG